MKKTPPPISIFEEHLDKQATTTVEKDNAREVEQIMAILNRAFSPEDSTVMLIQVLVAKGIVSLKDFKRVLGE